VFVLGWILGMLAWEGLTALSPRVFTQVTPGPGSEGGGLANAIVGSLILTFLGIVVATPIGVLAGTFLAEYGNRSRLATVVRFINDILLSAPSILIGLFVYTLMVQPLGGYSGWAGAVALAIIATPVIVRTTEDMLRLVPNTLREAGAALGAPTAQVITGVTWRAARAGIVTGILLAMARIAGETAPLLFTALNNNFGSTRPCSAASPPARHHLPVRALALSELAGTGLGGRRFSSPPPSSRCRWWRATS
jgi:phosphate transport system permease protein